MINMNTKLDFVTVGEAMAMFIAKDFGELSKVESFIKKTAGAELNVAIGLARLNFKVGWLSRLGKDSFGDFILQVLQKENINSDGIIYDELHSTGLLLKEKVIDGSDPRVEYYRKNSAASYLSVKDIEDKYILSAQQIHLTGVAAAISDTCYDTLYYIANLANKNGKIISFDPNLRPALWKNKEIMCEKINHLAFLADYFMPGIAEGKILTGKDDAEDIADFYLEKGVKLIVIKQGGKGTFYKNDKGCTGIVPTYKVDKIVDTVGAGDGFAVGLISGLQEGLNVEKAIRRGNLIGSLVIQNVGDSEGLPKREIIKKYEELS